MRLALELALTFGPLLLLLGPLVLRCYPGEAHILKHRLKARLARVRRLRSRWPRRPRPARHTALSARTPLSRRGPPVLA
jgi:hypothetical protein